MGKAHRVCGVAHNETARFRSIGARTHARSDRLCECANGACLVVRSAQGVRTEGSEPRATSHLAQLGCVGGHISGATTSVAALTFEYPVFVL